MLDFSVNYEYRKKLERMLRTFMWVRTISLMIF